MYAAANTNFLLIGENETCPSRGSIDKSLFYYKASNDSEPTFKKNLHGIINSYRDNLRWLMFCLKLWWTFQISLTVFVFAFSKCGLNIPHKSVFIFYKLRNMIYNDCLWCDLFVIIWFFKNHIINFAGYCSILRFSLFLDW